jgi:CheY-like chemotaxis protein
MDVEMPEMDGLEATAAIRRREQATGAHIPILAMTAYAMKGDRERCLAAGMDGYVSKPILAQELLETIDRLVATGRQPLRDESMEALSRPGLDLKAALKSVGGDPKLLGQLVKVFLGECAGSLQGLRQALLARNSAEVRRLAHSFKGSLWIFRAQAAFDAALRLETLARSGDLTQAAEAGAALETELERLQPVLAALNKST